MKNISIAMIVAQFPNVVQTYIKSSISGLQQIGIEVSVIATIRPDKKTPFSLQGKEIPKHIFYTEITFPKILISLLTLPIFSIKYWLLVLKLIKLKISKEFSFKYFIKALIRVKAFINEDYDLIHSHNLTLSYEFLFLKKLFSIPIITTFHGKEPRGSKTLSSKKQQVLFKEADCFLVNTNFAKRSLLELGCSEDKITIIPQGTNIKDFPFHERSISTDDKINILTVGRLSIEKGQHVAIKAISNLISSFPNIHYHLIGHGPELNSLRELIHKLKIQQFVTLHGYADTQQLKKIYAEANIFILPSIDLKDGLHVETQGVAIQEAQSSGLPVIASNTGGIPEIIINNITGLLFTENDSSDLSNKITKLITDDSLYSKLQKNGRKDVEDRFNTPVISSQLQLIYKDLL